MWLRQLQLNEDAAPLDWLQASSYR